MKLRSSLAAFLSGLVIIYCYLLCILYSFHSLSLLNLRAYAKIYYIYTHTSPGCESFVALCRNGSSDVCTMRRHLTSTCTYSSPIGEHSVSASWLMEDTFSLDIDIDISLALYKLLARISLSSSSSSASPSGPQPPAPDGRVPRRTSTTSSRMARRTSMSTASSGWQCPPPNLNCQLRMTAVFPAPSVYLQYVGIWRAQAIQSRSFGRLCDQFRLQRRLQAIGASENTAPQFDSKDPAAGRYAHSFARRKCPQDDFGTKH